MKRVIKDAVSFKIFGQPEVGEILRKADSRILSAGS
jgi:hypothetical protein